MKEPWRVVSVASEDTVATIAFRDSLRAERDRYAAVLNEIGYHLGNFQGQVAIEMARNVLAGDSLVQRDAEDITEEEAGLRQAATNALAASSWDDAQAILFDALRGHHKNHELSHDCWCQPRVEKVAPA